MSIVTIVTASHPSRCRCAECDKMWCKVYNCKAEQLTGWCAIAHKAVNGDDLCHHPREPTLWD